MHKFAKLTALTLAVFMLLLSAGCGTANKQGGETTAAVTQAASDTAPATEPMPDPVTLKMMLIVNGDIASGEATDPIGQYVKEKMNITMDVETVPEGEYLNKLNVQISTNDLPDLFFLPGGKPQLDQLLTADLIHDLTPYVEKVGKNLTTEPESQFMMDFIKGPFNPKNDGKLYAIGLCRGTADDSTHPLVSHYIRWDAYKGVGYPKIGNPDELLAALEQMQKANPTTKDGKKVYAIGGWWGEAFGWGIDWAIRYTGSFPYGIGYSAEYVAKADIATGKYVNENQLTTKTSQFWNTLKWWNKANRMGLLDPDTFVQKYTDYEQKLNGGRYLYTYANWLANGADAAYAAAGTPDVGFVVVPPMGDQIALKTYQPQGERIYAVAKSCQAPERAVAFLDWCSSYEGTFILTNGVEGKYWKTVDGKPVPTEEYINAVKAGTTIDPKETGMNLYSKLVGAYWATIDPRTNETFGLRYNSVVAKQLAKPFEADAAKVFGVNTLADVLKKATYTSQSGLVGFALPLQSDELKATAANLTDYVNKGMINFVTAKSDADFDKLQDEFIKGLAPFKTDEILKWYMDAMNQIAPQMDPLLERAKEIINK